MLKRKQQSFGHLGLTECDVQRFCSRGPALPPIIIDDIFLFRAALWMGLEGMVSKRRDLLPIAPEGRRTESM
jgi:hypothetical protein